MFVYLNMIYFLITRDIGKLADELAGLFIEEA
jgi:hypothetical protein